MSDLMTLPLRRIATARASLVRAARSFVARCPDTLASLVARPLVRSSHAWLPLARRPLDHPPLARRSFARRPLIHVSLARLPLVRSPLACLPIACLLVAALAGSPAAADDARSGPAGGVVVIAHPDLRIRSIDGEEIRQLFLGKSRTLPNGARAVLASHGPSSAFFNDRVIGLSDARVATIWSRLRFAGRLPPPEVFDAADDVVDFVASTPDAIAYVPTETRRDDVRVIYSVPR